jgi:hypothetical protein
MEDDSGTGYRVVLTEVARFIGFSFIAECCLAVGKIDADTIKYAREGNSLM